MLYIGIDPGIKGAISIIDGSGNLLECILFPSKKEVSDKGRNISRQDMPKLAKLFKDLRAKYCLNPMVIMVEKPLLMPGQHVSSTFYGGVSHGVLQAFLAIYFEDVLIEHVSCKDWQSDLITDRTFCSSKIRRDRRKQLKLDSIAAAKELFPDAIFSKNKKSKVDSDGMTDSALIAYYCYKQHV